MTYEWNPGFDPGFDTRRKHAQEMYDMMIRQYCRVFQDQLTPFHHLWKTSDHAAALRGNKDLIALFDQYKDAEAVHCMLYLSRIFTTNMSTDQRDVNEEDDIVYVAMFAEKKNKKHKAPAHFFNEYPLAERLRLIQGKDVNTSTEIGLEA
jgi:hypothetical protein